MSEPKWLTIARTQLGHKEVTGDKDNPEIMKYYKAAKQGGIKHDETAWCSAFANWVIRTAGYAPTYSLLARSWLKWGKAVKPQLGAIMVFKRLVNGVDDGLHGHVCFYVGETEKGYKVLGGNQSNAVTITTIAKDRLLGARWPITVQNSATVKNTAAGIGTIATTQTIQPLFDGLSQIQPDLMNYAQYIPMLTWAGVACGLALMGWGLYKRVANIKDTSYDNTTDWTDNVDESTSDPTEVTD